MGYVKHKYTREYFLGSTSSRGRPIGVAGYEEFRSSKIAPRFTGYLQIATSAAGDLKGKHVLDIGCGRGEMLHLCLKSGAARVVGVDFSADALEIVRAWIRDGRLRLFQQEARETAFNAEFDVVFLLDVVEHVPRWEINEVYARARKALRHGGVIVLHTPIFTTRDEPDCTTGVPEIEGMHCNRQTFRSLLRSFRRHSLAPVTLCRDVFVLRRKEDCSLQQHIRGLAGVQWHRSRQASSRLRRTLRRRAGRLLRLLVCSRGEDSAARPQNGEEIR